MLIGLDEFANGDLEQVYERMRPDQRTAVANEFVRVLVLAADPHAGDFRYAAADPFAASGRDFAPPEESRTVQPNLPHLLSPAEAASVHRYTREHHPDLFDAVAHHPVTQAALAFPGAPSSPEQPTQPETPLGEEAIVRPFIAGSAPDALTPEFTGESIATPGIEVGEIEKRDHNAVNRAISPDAGEAPA